MIWFTWRQFRTPAVITAGALAVFAVVLLVSANSITDLYASVATCQSDCGNAIDAFLSQVRTGAGGTIYNIALAIMYAAPPLIGVFWGAPLIAREIEAGTHRLAWNQSITRSRWLATKLAVVGGATVLATGLLSWAVTTWAERIDSAAADRITPLVFGARGVVPVAYALFAFTLGVTCGMVIHRTVPAMAATLGVYAVAVASMPLWLRAHLYPTRHETPALDMGNLDALLIDRQGSMLVKPNDVANAWTVSNQTVTSTGQPFTGPADQTHCGPNAPTRGCDEWVGSLGLRQDVVYHPDSHYWPLQWIEAGVFVALAALLAAVSFWWLRRRLT